MRRFLPRFYVEGFADPHERGEGGRLVWVHRSNRHQSSTSVRTDISMR